MRKLNGAIAVAALVLALGSGTAPATAAPAEHGDIPSVPEAWSPEGRAPYTPPPTPEAWSPEGRRPAG